jgi:hypothetical protein
MAGGEQGVGRRGSSARAAALRRAQQAKAGRDAERVLRERQIEIALADWFEATARADRIRDDASRKAAAVTEAGEHAAAGPAGEAGDAVRRLRELTGSNGEVAALCGASPPPRYGNSSPSQAPLPGRLRTPRGRGRARRWAAMTPEHPSERRSGTVREDAARPSGLAGAASRWELRYDGRAGYESRIVLDLVSSGLLDLGSGMRGADGVLYRAGGYSCRSQLHGTAVVLVQARGGHELLAGWESPLAVWDWVRGRLPSADGPLPELEGGPSRMACEERLLAWGLRYPWELDWLAGAMRGHVLSCDARDEIFAAAVHLHGRGGTVDAGTVAAEVSRRYRQAPAWAREELGGPGAPWIGRYVQRLAVTEVSPGAAAAAAMALGPCLGPAVRTGGPARLPPRPHAVMVPPPAHGPRAGPVPQP